MLLFTTKDAMITLYDLQIKDLSGNKYFCFYIILLHFMFIFEMLGVV